MPSDIEIDPPGNPSPSGERIVEPGMWNGEPCEAMPWQDDDYDPEADAEEDSADLSDDALAEHFDADGYEKD